MTDADIASMYNLRYGADGLPISYTLADIGTKEPLNGALNITTSVDEFPMVRIPVTTIFSASIFDAVILPVSSILPIIDLSNGNSVYTVLPLVNCRELS